MSRDIIAFVAVLDQCGAPALVFGIGEAGHQHAAGEGINAMRTHGATGHLLEIIDGLHVTRLRWRGMYVEDKKLAGLEAGEPETPAVVRKPGVVRFVSAAYGVTVNHLSVTARAGFNVHDHEFVGT